MSIGPPSGGRAARPCVALVMIIALTIGATNSLAEVLRGQLSGLEHHRDRVDLRMRFFSTIDADRLLTELNFDQVELDRGTFEVSLEHRALPPDARFVAIALRPSERRYSAFQAIPPRRRLERRPGTVLIAAVRTEAPTHGLARSPTKPVMSTSINPGERP